MGLFLKAIYYLSVHWVMYFYVTIWITCPINTFYLKCLHLFQQMCTIYLFDMEISSFSENINTTSSFYVFSLSLWPLYNAQNIALNERRRGIFSSLCLTSQLTKYSVLSTQYSLLSTPNLYITSSLRELLQSLSPISFRGLSMNYCILIQVHILSSARLHTCALTEDWDFLQNKKLWLLDHCWIFRFISMQYAYSQSLYSPFNAEIHNSISSYQCQCVSVTWKTLKSVNT